MAEQTHVHDPEPRFDDVPGEIVARLTAAMLSDSLDAAGVRGQVMSARIGPVTSGSRAAGRARTVRFEPSPADSDDPYAAAMLVKPGDIPGQGGLYLLDVIPDGEVRWGFPNINDNAEAAELMACGAHLILFTTGRGSVVGSAISPIIKVCGNPETYARMADDMDVDAGRIIDGRASLAEVGDEIFGLVQEVAAGRQTASEAMGHQEFVLTYKSFEPVGPACLPLAATPSRPLAAAPAPGVRGEGRATAP